MLSSIVSEEKMAKFVIVKAAWTHFPLTNKYYRPCTKSYRKMFPLQGRASSTEQTAVCERGYWGQCSLFNIQSSVSKCKKTLCVVILCFTILPCFIPGCKKVYFCYKVEHFNSFSFSFHFSGLRLPLGLALGTHELQCHDWCRFHGFRSCCRQHWSHNLRSISIDCVSVLTDKFTY